MSRKTYLVISAGTAYPVMTHSAIVLGRPDLAVFLIAALAAFYGLYLCREFKRNGLQKGAFDNQVCPHDDV